MSQRILSVTLLGLLLAGCGDFDLPHRGSANRPSLQPDGGHRIIINGGEDDPGNPGVPGNPGNPANPWLDGGAPPLPPDSGVPQPKPDTKPAPPPPGPAPDSGQPAPGACGNDFESQVFALVNQERQKAGKQPFLCDQKAVAVAHGYSQVMCDKNHFSHTGPDGSSPFQRMQKGGIQFSSAGENIAAGQATPAEVMNSWMNSSGHRANILGNYKYYGGGYVPCAGGGGGGWLGGGGYGHYWTQNFWSP